MQGVGWGGRGKKREGVVGEVESPEEKPSAGRETQERCAHSQTPFEGKPRRIRSSQSPLGNILLSLVPKTPI